MKKLALCVALVVCILIGWFITKTSSHPIEEAQNLFSTSIYTQYRIGMKDFLLRHPDYAKMTSSKQHKALNELLDEIERLPIDQRASHELLVKKLRGAIQDVGHRDENSKRLIQDLIHWIFIEADTKPAMQSFLYSKVNPPDHNFLAYLQNTQKALHDHPQFSGIKEGAPYEDQFFHGNLPSYITTINQQTKLIRLGQPVIQSSQVLLWGSSWKVSPEFLLFVQEQPFHLYVNLLKRKGAEGAIAEALEGLEERLGNFSLITLDKDSSFYWQNEKGYPEVWESEPFKEAFLNKMSTSTGNYFWSRHLDPRLWKKELKQIVNQIHQSSFYNKMSLSRSERQDFIELTYLAILNHLAAKWNPTSMNITCRQGMDRGPSLMVLWILQNRLLDEKEMAALLLAPPLVTRNRASHASRIERLISSAKRL